MYLCRKDNCGPPCAKKGKGGDGKVSQEFPAATGRKEGRKEGGERRRMVSVAKVGKGGMYFQGGSRKARWG